MKFKLVSDFAPTGVLMISHVIYALILTAMQLHEIIGWHQVE
jgi:hypothetical protein